MQSLQLSGIQSALIESGLSILPVPWDPGYSSFCHQVPVEKAVSMLGQRDLANPNKFMGEESSFYEANGVLWLLPVTTR